jgi:hypothetical protein
MSVIGKEGSTRRKRFLVHGANALLASIGSIGIAVVGYILVDRYRPFRVDLTSTGLYGLSPRTLDILEEVKGGVSITYFELPPSEVSEADVINSRVLDLLEEYKTRSGGKITYEIANPLREPLLVEELGADYGTAVFRRDKDTLLVPWKEFSTQSFDDMSESASIKFTGEEAFSSALLRLGEGGTNAACFLTGHGEYSTESDEATGYSEIGRMLRGNNLNSREVDLAAPAQPDAIAPLKLDAPAPSGAAAAVPADCTVLVIAGPSKGAFSDAEIDAIAAFYDSGRGIVLLAEPMTNTRVDVLVKRFGLEVVPGVVLDAKRMIKSPVYVVPEWGKHAVTQVLEAAELNIVLPESGALKPAGEPNGALLLTPLMSSSPASMVVVDIKDGEPDPASKKNIDGPATLGFAVEKTLAEGKTARAIVLGDADFGTNAILGTFADGNPLFAENAITWAAGSRKKLDIGPKDPGIAMMGTDLTDSGALWILLSTAVLVPGTILSTGMFVFIRRRSR